MSMPLSQIQEQAKQIGFGNVVGILMTIQRYYSGWESDSEGWIVRLDDGTAIGLSTNHGSLCRWTESEMRGDLADAQTWANSIAAALREVVVTPPVEAKPKTPLFKRVTVCQFLPKSKIGRATQTDIAATLDALARWAQEHYGRDSSDSGSGHITVPYIKSILKISEEVTDDSDEAPGWHHTRVITMGDAGVIGYINLKTLDLMLP